MFYSLLIFTISVTVVFCENFCANWESINNQKCIKIIDKEKQFTYEEAVKSCYQLENGSTLITINSKEEQELITKYLFQTLNITNNVWLGLKYNNNKFEWIDKTSVELTNWMTGSPSIKTDYNCVEMASESVLMGKWVDVLCNKTNVAVCQKSTYSYLEKTLIETRKHLSDTISNLNTCLYKNWYNKFLNSSAFIDSGGKNKKFIFRLNQNKEGVQWNEANIICAKYNATIVEVQTASKQHIIELFLQDIFIEDYSSKYFWLNAHKNSSGNYTWFTSGKDVTYFKVDKNYPIKHAKDCLFISGGLVGYGFWYEKECDDRNLVLCETDVNV